MLLGIDVGNTQILIGLFEGTDLVDQWRLATNAERTSDEYSVIIGQLIGELAVDGVAISSVVPRATAALRDMVTRYFGVAPVVV